MESVLWAKDLSALASPALQHLFRNKVFFITKHLKVHVCRTSD